MQVLYGDLAPRTVKRAGYLLGPSIERNQGEWLISMSPSAPHCFGVDSGSVSAPRFWAELECVDSSEAANGKTVVLKVGHCQPVELFVAVMAEITGGMKGHGRAPQCLHS